MVTPATPGFPRGTTLALDAAASIGTVAVLRDGAVVAERTIVMRSADEERYLPAVLAALEEAGTSAAAVDQVVCGAGPGSFTSLRVAGAIAKGIALGAGCPLLAVPSLALIAASAEVTREAGSRWLVTLDAMRGDRYLALVEVGADLAVTHFEPLGLAPSAAVPGHAEALGARVIGPGERLEGTPHARGLVRCLALVAAGGPVDLDAWEPVYGRLAEAEVKRAEAEARAREAAAPGGA